MKQQITIDIVKGKTIKGHVILTDWKPNDIKIRIKTFIEIKGKIGTEKINLNTLLLGDIKVNSSSQKIPYELELGVNNYDTYNGVNVEFNYVIEAEIDVPRKLRPLRTKTYVKVERDYDYIVVDKNYKVPYLSGFVKTQFKKSRTLKFIPYIALGVLPLVFICVVYDLIPIERLPYLMFGISVLTSIIIFTPIIRIYKNSKKVNLSFDIKKDTDGFIANFDYDHTIFKINSLGYKISEISIDSRGTTDITESKEIYRSDAIPYASNNQFSFPKKTGFNTIGTKDSFIQWEMYGSGTFIENSQKYDFEAPFDVSVENMRNIRISK